MAERLLSEAELLQALNAEAEDSSAPQKKTGYYARPEFGKESESLYQTAKTAESEVSGKKTAFQKAQIKRREAEESLALMSQHVQLLQENYQRSGTEYSKKLMQDARNLLEQQMISFADIQGGYDKAYADYDSAHRNYTQAVSRYNSYQDTQRAQIEAWKGTIRDGSTVQGELDTLDAQISKLKKEDKLSKLNAFAGKLANSLANGLITTSSGLAPTAVQYPAATNDAKLRELEAARALLQEEYDWGQFYRYDDLRATEDFAEKSKYASTANGKSRTPLEIMMGTYSEESSGWDDPLYEFINGNQEAGAFLSNTGASYYGPEGGAIGAAFGRVTEDENQSRQMSKDEVKIFNYLYATEGREAAHAYYAYLQSDLNARQREAEEKYWAEYAAENPVGSSVFSVATAPAKGMSYLGQTMDYLDDGRIDQNASYNKFSYTGSAIREQVSKDVEKKWGKAGSFAYQTGMSMADFLLNTAITGGNSALSMTIMGTGAAADATIEAKDRGLSDDQAFALGTIAGAAEAITEKISIDALLGRTGMGKTAVGYILKNALAEGSEEAASTLINTMADILIAKDKSQWQMSIDAYVAEGKTEGEAFGLALRDQAVAMGLDALGGFLSGGIMGGGGAIISDIDARVQGNTIGKQNLDIAQMQAMIKEGLSNDSKTRSHYLAQQLQQKLARGEKLTNYDLGRLQQANAAVEEADRGVNEVPEDLFASTQQTAKQAGTANVGTLEEQAERLGKLVGREVVLYTADATEDGIENGYYKDGKLYINSKGTDPFVQTFSHELTHSVELADVYQELSEVVMGRIAGTGADIGQLRQQKAALYAQNGVTLKDRSEIDREIVADYVARNLLSDEQSIAELTREKPNLGRRILNWLDGLLAKLGNRNAQERAFLSRVRNLYAQALEQSQSSFTEETAKAPTQTQSAQTDAKNPDAKEMRDWMHKEYADEEWTEEEENDFFDLYLETEDLENSAEPAEVKHSFAGHKASGADLDALDRAKQMQAAGVADETIRQDTGWSMGRDGKWHWKTEAADQTQKNTPSEVEGADEEAGLWDKNDEEGKIYPGMDEDTRAAILQQKEIRIPVYDDSNPVTGAQIIRLKGLYTSEANELLRTLAKNCGVISAEYYNASVDLEFKYSMRSVRESINKQAARGGGAESFGKMLTLLPEICENAVEIEAHTDKYIDTKRMDPNLKETHVLLAAFADGPMVIPVQLEIKEYKPETRMDNKLYVTVTVKNEAGISSRVNAASRASTGTHNTPASEISVADLIADVKDDTGDLVKYMPDSMLNPEQLQAKNKAIQREQSKILDMRYEYAVREGKTDKAEQLLRDKATEQGYSADDAWRMRHRAPNASDGISVSITDADQMYGGDGSIYSPLAETYYGEGRAYDWKAIQVLSKARNNPDAMITVYRAVPNSVRDTRLRNGDWVTQTREYAKDHGEMELGGDYRIISEKVPAKHLYVNGDSIHELGYDNGRADEVYKNTENNVKLSGVTYDDDGNLIPLSKRYDEKAKNIRYSISPHQTEQTQAEPEGLSLPTVEEDPGAEIRSKLPAKARDYLKRAESKLLSHIGESLSVPRFAQREYLKEIVQAISTEYLQNGAVSEETTSRLFETAYEQGVVVDQEFYAKYKGVKDYLRATAVTISARDQADITNYADFQRKASKTLRIVNEGGMPVSEAYGKLREMASDLFPDNLVRPADQLQHMQQVGRSIYKAERSLRAYHEGDTDFQRWARRDFGAAIDNVMSELRTVKRFVDEQAEQEAKAQKAPMTTDEAMETYAQLKEARKNYEKVYAKNLLTDHDEALVGDLLRGKISLENLDPEAENVKGITAVYEAKKAMEDISKQITAYKRSLHKKARDKADQYLETANDWKDKKVGLAYSRETMRRNVQDIVPDKDVADAVNREYFEPVAVAEAAATRFKEQYRKRAKELRLSRKVEKGNVVSEAHAVQLLGESLDNIKVIENARGRLKTRDGKSLSEWRAVVDNLWMENPSLDRAKIEQGVEAFRKIYDELFQQMNRERVANGYEPVNYRKGYFPHFQPGQSDGILAHFGRIMGIDTSVVALPTTINGLTHTFKPGIQWFGNAQERLGFNTAYDALEGFDKYIEGVASVIHQTKNIQNLRALATQMRYRTSDEGIRKQVDAVQENPRLTEEEKQVQIAEIYSHGKYTLSNFVVELDEYTNILANKKSKLDRTVEGLFGRKFYTFMKWWESRVGANMIAGNLSSALTNFIPLTQAGAQLDSRSMLQGMWNTLKAIKADDGIVETSDFLTNRRGSDPLIKTWEQKASAVAGKPMELIDSFVSGSIVRAAYYQNLKQGISEAEALHQADIFAASVMADRSKGAMPTLFASTNPLFKAFTQFQLEVNNQFSEVFKDLPRGFKNKGLKVLAGVLFKYFIGAFLFNDLFEHLFGRRPALDPIGILNDTIGDLSGYELPNLLELDEGFETDRVGFGQATKNLAGNLLEELPFSSGLTLFGIETDGGRLPASSAVPDLTALWDAATTEGWSPKKRVKEAWDEISKPLTYIVPPFGGNQIAKTWKGLAAYFRGGSYNVDKDGNDILQYPVYKDDTGDAFWNLVRAMIMGKSSLPEAQDWVESGFDSLSAKQTAAYQDMVEAGVLDRDAYVLLMELQGAAKTEEASKAEIQRQIIRDSGVSGEGKAIAYYGMVASEADRELMDKLADLGAGAAETVDTVMGLRDLSELKGMEKKQAQSKLISGSGMTDEEKSVVLESILGSELMSESGNPTQYAKFLCARETGLSIDGYLELYGAGVDLDDYFELTDAGMDPKEAKDLAVYVQSLKPADGKGKVTDLQKWRAAVDNTSSDRDKLAALSAVMSDDQYRKVEIANSFAVTPGEYVRMREELPKFDTDGNGSFTQAELTAAVDSMPLSTQQKAALWQLAATTNSAKNNPYSVEIGEKVLAAKQATAEKSEAEPENLSFSEEIMRQLLGRG